MADLKHNIIDVIGRTPLLRLDAISKDLPGNIAAKLEFQNPMRSIKDRPALAMIEAAEMRGDITEGTTLIEATSGNTGLALAFICAAKKYPLIIVMPEYANKDNVRMLKALGADVHLTPTELLMKGAIDKAIELVESTPQSFMPMQFNNPANSKAHFDLTGPEIWEATDGEINVFLAGVGTGGTISGVGQYLKSRKPSVELVAVEPRGCAVLSGEEPGHHQLIGIGSGFVPDILEVDLLDQIIKIGFEEAAEMCRFLAKEAGILAGISTGANLVAAKSLAEKDEYAEQLIVTVMCDTGERYFDHPIF